MEQIVENVMAFSKKSNYNKSTKYPVNEDEDYPNSFNEDAVATEFQWKSTKANVGWNDEQLDMLRWLIKQGYDEKAAKKLVVAAYKLETGNMYAIGRVIRSLSSEFPVTWEGDLLPRNYINPSFSKKVFIGGVPWDITEADLRSGFQPYGISTIEWPKIIGNVNNLHSTRAIGYVYMVFEKEGSIRKLLQDCTRDHGSAGEYHFKLSARRAQASTEIRQVQIIPWVVSDSVYVSSTATKIDRSKTVFVGALHGMLTAEILYYIMNEVYGSVVFVCLDNDQYKYPIGSGRVTFSTEASFFQAIEDGFLEIRTSKFIKKIQIDPFLEYSRCSQCLYEEGIYFCRNRNCFKYFCARCWEHYHATLTLSGSHKAVVRQSKRIPLKSGDKIMKKNTRFNFIYDLAEHKIFELQNYFEKAQISPIWASETLVTLNELAFAAFYGSRERYPGYWSTKKRATTFPKTIKLPIKSSFYSVDSSDTSSAVDLTTSGESGEEQSTVASNKSSDAVSCE